jgi:hypothetical protein
MDHLALGMQAEDKGSFDEARWHYERGAKGGVPEALFNLALLLLKRGELTRAEDLFAEHIARYGPTRDARRGIGHCAVEQGRTGYAVTAFESAQCDSEELFYRLHLPDGLEEDWSAQIAHRSWASAQARGEPLDLDWDGKRPLRVGYIGWGLIQTVANFLDPVITQHDQSVVHAFVIAANDTLSGVRSAQLDIAVDLLGHMAGGPTQHLFVAGIAPLQCSYIGYPHATGLDDVVRITDSVMDPPGFYGEQVLRLPGCAYAYRPDREAPEPKMEPHAGVVFASLNRPCKITQQTARAWGKIISADKSHRLRVLAHGGERNLAVRVMLEAAGVPGERLELVPKRPPAEYLAALDEVDVILDVVDGYCGMTTTCDALWQGVPAVTCFGSSSRSRVGFSIEQAVRGVMAATGDPNAYVDCALALARQRTGDDRRLLRLAMKRSPLLDGRRVAAALEDLWIDQLRRQL